MHHVRLGGLVFPEELWKWVNTACLGDGEGSPHQGPWP